MLACLLLPVVAVQQTPIIAKKLKDTETEIVALMKHTDARKMTLREQENLAAVKHARGILVEEQMYLLWTDSLCSNAELDVGESDSTLSTNLIIFAHMTWIHALNFQIESLRKR